MPDYNPLSIQQKWQHYWEENGINTLSRQDLVDAEKPFYNLVMFPYPSAEGLHIGNVFAYTGADVLGRFKRLNNFDVFEPMGFDAFGIHSENFALKQGIHPNRLVPSNISNFTRQLKLLGLMLDWNHQLDTTSPDYYKWTQWLFIRLFKAGLAEQREGKVNWCPSCKTVVANEQVIQGLCERCDSHVEGRSLLQWFFKISKYAPRLLDNLDEIDWSDRTVASQRNWIGRSDGVEIKFDIVESDQSIQAFTTRADTLAGATFIVLAPEHPLVTEIATSGRLPAVSEYVNETSKRSVVDRQRPDQEKTGVWTGAFCINPITQQQMPVWVADYVLVEYGTGAIMAVPAHDQRDFDFAKEFDLPVRQVIRPPNEEGSEELTEAYVGPGVMINSLEFDGLANEEGKRQVTESLQAKGKADAVISYRLHDWCISRQRYWGPPIPIIHCESCGAQPVPEEDLPVVLPSLDNFQPDESGHSPLARDTEWMKVDCPSCAKPARRETDVSDNFLDSGWYFLRYPCTDNHDSALDVEMLKKWFPVTSYIGGQEHAVLHLMYARFLTMALNDLGLVDDEEPFQKFRAHGVVVKDGRKMSKSRGNVVNPDDLIDAFGADVVRTHLMFLGPFEKGGDHQDDGIHGPASFLRRAWQSVYDAEDKEMDPEIERVLHRTVKKVTDDYENLRFNTAIAAMMEYLNVVRFNSRKLARDEVEPLVILLAPVAPHLAEELWEKLGHRESIFTSASWPEYDPAKAVADLIEIGVQINGKVRGTIKISIDADEEQAMDSARNHPNVASYLEGATIRKSVFIPKRTLSLVLAN